MVSTTCLFLTNAAPYREGVAGRSWAGSANYTEVKSKRLLRIVVLTSATPIIIMILSILSVASIKLSAGSTDDQQQPSYAVTEFCTPVLMGQPVLKDDRGNLLSYVTFGQTVFVSAAFVACSDDEVPFVVIVEARDENNVTVYLQFQTGTLNANGSAESGFSWSPDKAGRYELRTFALSDLLQPQILSQIQTNEVTIRP